MNDRSPLRTGVSDRFAAGTGDRGLQGPGSGQGRNTAPRSALLPFETVVDRAFPTLVRQDKPWRAFARPIGCGSASFRSNAAPSIPSGCKQLDCASPGGSGGAPDSVWYCDTPPAPHQRQPNRAHPPPHARPCAGRRLLDPGSRRSCAFSTCWAAGRSPERFSPATRWTAPEICSSLVARMLWGARIRTRGAVSHGDSTHRRDTKHRKCQVARPRDRPISMV